MKMLLSLAAVAALAAGPVYAGCTYPKAPEKIPDGNTATLEEMQAAVKAVKQFDADISAYQTCLETEYNEALAKDGASLTEEQKADRAKKLAQKQDAAGTDSQAAADRLNAQIRVFKEKNKKKE
ncbi:MAG: hypothetical protein U1F11_03985 [Steroidobacteraceae bacterium]